MNTQSVSTIRLPAVAGSFYPGDARTLARTVDELLGEGARTAAMPPVRVLVVPHAGYMYSGKIAGAGFSRAAAAATPPSRAFIIGPSHFEAFAHTSIYPGSAYRTPLGDVPIDTSAARALRDSEPSVRLSSAGHDPTRGAHGEHAIEVELPFLQRAFPVMSIVPLVMGSQSWESCEALANAIAKVIDWKHDILVASSDLSHFHDDASARVLDGAFCDSLLALDARALFARVSRGECEACGAGPVVAALLASSSLANCGGEVLVRGNSGDISGDHSSVVGYAAAIVTGDVA